MCSLCVLKYIRYTQGILNVYTRYTQGEALTLRDTLFNK